MWVNYLKNKALFKIGSVESTKYVFAWMEIVPTSIAVSFTGLDLVID